MHNDSNDTDLWFAIVATAACYLLYKGTMLLLGLIAARVDAALA